MFGHSQLGDQAYVLDQMINIVRDAHPDVMLICGDIFDKPWPEEEALSLFHSTIASVLELKTAVIALAGVSDDFSRLHLDARWVRRQGLYLIDEPNYVLSPINLKAAGDSFAVNFWGLPFTGSRSKLKDSMHPAQRARKLVEAVATRLDQNLINVFAGYAWVQGLGKKPELSKLNSSGGQPIEKRLLDYFDYCALGGCHSPTSLGSTSLHYSGGLISNEPDLSLSKRSVNMVSIEGKGKLLLEEFPLHSRRRLRLLSGSYDELIAQSREQKSEDLLVLRLEGESVTPEQKLHLKSMSANVVALEVVDEAEFASAAPGFKSSSRLVQAAIEFYRDVNPEALLSGEAIEALERIGEEP